MPRGSVFVGELPYGSKGSFNPKMDHLVCFLPGTLALSATKGITKRKALELDLLTADDLESLSLTEDLAKTCFEMYSVTSTGLAPKIAYFNIELSWFPFILYDTDWMGREVFHGDPKGTPAQMEAYDKGIKAGAYGLLINSVVLGVSSFLIEPMCGKFTPRIVWVMSNFFVCVCMAATAIIGTWTLQAYHGSIQDAIITPDGKVKTVAIILFSVLGLPLAILYSVPFAVTAQLAANEGGGQGLCTGVLNYNNALPIG